MFDLNLCFAVVTRPITKHVRVGGFHKHQSMPLPSIAFKCYMNIEYRTSIKDHDMTCNHDKLYKSLNGCTIVRGPSMELASPLASRHRTGKETDVTSQQHSLSGESSLNI